MIHTNQKIIKHKVGLLNLADELGNISKACKTMGVSRDTFYRYRDAVESYSQIWCLNTFQATSLSASVPALTPSLKQIPCTTSASSLKPLNLRQPF